MARLTHAQRLDMLEQELAGVPNRVAQEITTALAAFKTDIAAQIAASRRNIELKLFCHQQMGRSFLGTTHLRACTHIWRLEKEVIKVGNPTGVREDKQTGDCVNLIYLCLTA